MSSDNSVGIDSRYLDRVFGLFEQLNQSTDGTGVGLAVVKRIVESHGGKSGLNPRVAAQVPQSYLRLMQVVAKQDKK